MFIDNIPHQPVVRRRLDAEATTMPDALQPDDQIPQLLHFDHKDTAFYAKHQGKTEKDTKKGALTHDCESGLSLKRRRLPTLPHCIAVPSAQAGLTSLFGMGRGGTPLQ